MQILLTAPTPSEMYRGNFLPVDFLCTGVGAGHSIYHLGKAINKNKYDLILQIGICGSFSPSIRPGETVFVQKDRFADLGIWEKEGFTGMDELGFLQANEVPYVSGWLENNYHIRPSLNIPEVKAITINSIHENPQFNQILFEKYNAQIESMEGAALHYVCVQENIPFIQLRAVSNWVGDRDKKNWKLKEAISNLHIHTEKILTDIINK